MRLDLRAPLREIEGIGPVRERQLGELGIVDVGSFLGHLPIRYEDRRRITPIAEIEGEGDFTLAGRLREVRLVMRRGRRFSLVRGRLEDASGELTVVWFNRPYMPRQVDATTDYLLHGRVRRRPSGLELRNPSCEPLASSVHSGRIVPVYGALGPLGPALVRRLMTRLVERIGPVGEVEEPLPSELLERHGLPPLGRALEMLHRPGDDADVDELNRGRGSARRRLVYGELLGFQLRLAAARRRSAQRLKSHRVSRSQRVDRIVGDMLPFELTAAQRRVVSEVLTDLESERVMRRLVQGDVGSGKTAVAAAAFVAVVEADLQAAFMAPTELLAEQHFATLESLLGGRYRLELLCGSTAASADVREELAAGRVDLVVGTHALIQEGVEFRRLGLAVIDEQHRFGVGQRELLGRKGSRADLLVMTATPIPRTLTLTAYGDLDVSVIDELPPGRCPVETEVLPESRREEVYERLRDEVEAGGRAYVVFPRIEPGRQRGRSLEEGLAAMRRSYPSLPLGVLHGGTPVEERLRIMDEFAVGERRVLLATTVIEVGVDVPEATLMIVEGAEYFGLAQLHQLRGRVGRGEVPGRCVALHGELGEEGERRLAVLARTTDGFEIAEEDLQIRGPGELLGRRQAGAPDFRIADLRRDVDLLELARQDARRLALRIDANQLAGLANRLDGRDRGTAPARLRRA